MTLFYLQRVNLFDTLVHLDNLNLKGAHIKCELSKEQIKLTKIGQTFQQQKTTKYFIFT